MSAIWLHVHSTRIPWSSPVPWQTEEQSSVVQQQLSPVDNTWQVLLSQTTHRHTHCSLLVVVPAMVVLAVIYLFHVTDRYIMWCNVIDSRHCCNICQLLIPHNRLSNLAYMAKYHMWVWNGLQRKGAVAESTIISHIYPLMFITNRQHCITSEKFVQSARSYTVHSGCRTQFTAPHHLCAYQTSVMWSFSQPQTAC